MFPECCYISPYLDDLLERKISVKSRNLEGNFEYFSYRVGCSICCNGGGFGFQSNYKQLREKGDFLLNDIKIDAKHLRGLDLPILYKCSNKKYLKILFDIFKKIGDMNCCRAISYSFEDNEFFISACGITSLFVTERLFDIYASGDFELLYYDKNIDSVYICCQCFEWLKLFKPTINFNEFREINPIHLFWKETFKNYLNEDLVFLTEKDKDYVKDVFSEI